jgi:hypothetical protein
MPLEFLAQRRLYGERGNPSRPLPQDLDGVLCGRDLDGVLWGGERGHGGNRANARNGTTPPRPITFDGVLCEESGAVVEIARVLAMAQPHPERSTPYPGFDGSLFEQGALC